MKKFKLLTLISILILITSCSRDDGSSPPSLCLDSSFYALRTNNMSNTNNEINLIGNSSATNVANASPIDYYTLNFNGGLGASKSAFNPKNNTNTFYYIDEWNGGHKMIKGNVNAVSYNLISINFSQINSTFTAPVVDNGILYALEEDPSNNIYLVTIDQTTGVSTRVTGIAIPGFNLFTDPVGNKCYVTSNDSGTLYFLGDKLLEIDIFGTILNTYNRPNNFHYMDIIHHHDAVDPSLSSDGLFVAMADSSSHNGIVHWDLATGIITETDVITNLNFNPEVTSLAYNVCGDRLIALSNFVWNGTSNDATKIWDIAIPNDVLPGPNAATLVGTQIRSQFYFGLIHKD